MHLDTDFAVVWIHCRQDEIPRHRSATVLTIVGHADAVLFLACASSILDKNSFACHVLVWLWLWILHP